jgi:hypothetical protein
VFGVPGAAAGSSLAYCTSLGLSAAAYTRMSRSHLSELLLPRPSDLRLFLDTVRPLRHRLPFFGRAAAEGAIPSNR